jgi:DNA-binding MarR family transcriptional regulator
MTDRSSRPGPRSGSSRPGPLSGSSTPEPQSGAPTPVPPADERGLGPKAEASLHPHVRLALATWPQIDPAVEAIVNQIHDVDKLIGAEMRESLSQVSLTVEEFKVLMALQPGPRTHGSLCRQLEVSTGAMTNRLDKLEREELVSRAPDPRDRRGVLLALTKPGRERLDAYVDRGAVRERKLMGGLTATDKRRLNDLLATLLESLRAEQTG